VTLAAKPPSIPAGTPLRVPWFLKSNWRLHLALFITLSLPALIVGALLMTSARSWLVDQASNQNELTARLAVQALDQTFTGLKDYVESFSKRRLLIRAVEDRDADTARILLEDMVEMTPRITRAVLFDPAGTLQYDFPSDPQTAGQNFSHRDWYKGVSSTRDIYVSEMYRRASLGQPFVIAVTAPVTSAEGAIIGYLSGQMHVAELVDWIKLLHPGESGSVAIIDQSRQYITSRNVTSEPRRLTSDESIELLDRIGAESQETHHPLSWEPSLVSTFPAQAAPWRVLVAQTMSEVLSPMDSLLRTFVLLFSISLLITSSFGVIWMGTLKRYDRSRNEALQALVRSNDDLECRVRSRTEELTAANESLQSEMLERAEAEQRFRLAVEAAPNAMIMVNEEGTILLVNRQMENLFGYSRDELLDQSVDVLVPVRYRGPHPEQRRNFFVDPKPRSMGAGRDLFGLRKDGTEVPVEIGLNPIATAQGFVVLSSIVDISERKFAEDALRRSEERFRMAVESSPNAVVMINEAGNILLVNQQMETLFGYSRDELVGRSVDMLVPARFRDKHPEHRRDFFVDPTPRAMGAGRDLFGLRKDGTEVPVEIGLNPIATSQGFVVLSSIVDISERKKAEENLRRYSAELETRNKELDEFTYVASHDLQEPLRKLISFSKLLELDAGGDLSESARRDLHFIIDAAHRMRQLVQDLLSLSRAGKSDLDKQWTPLDSCVDQALSNLSARVEETQAAVARDPLPKVFCDRTLITQLFQNLIGNSLKFVPQGRRPEIHVSARREGDVWIMGVKDNGIGIPGEFADKVFVPFQRLHRRDQYEGSGIGLAICRKAVERHGGRIWVQSSAAEGTHIEFTLLGEPENRTCDPPLSEPSSLSSRMTLPTRS